LQELLSSSESQEKNIEYLSSIILSRGPVLLKKKAKMILLQQLQRRDRAQERRYWLHYAIDGLETVLEREGTTVEGVKFSILDTSGLSLSVSFFGVQQSYDFEYFGIEERAILTAPTERVILSMFLSANQGGVIRGEGTGKRESVNELGRLLGRRVVDC